jgi:GH15 family glucan-1,4-alpha-glucosidase
VPPLTSKLLESWWVPYQPIENYGVIGNMRTAALVGMNGSIDWYCFPAFDSPSIFGAILDDKEGGEFLIAPATAHTAKKQFYWPDTPRASTWATSPRPSRTWA